MTRKFWQAIRAASVLVIGLGAVSTAQATYSSNNNCGGGTTNPNCDTWTFNYQTSYTQGVITATASGWSNTADSANATNVLLDSAYIALNGSSGLGVRNNDCTGFANCTGGTSGREPSYPGRPVLCGSAVQRLVTDREYSRGFQHGRA